MISARTRFVQREILAGRDGVEAEELGLEVVVREKFVDAPQPEVSEFRGEEVGVDVDEFGGVENSWTKLYCEPQ